MIEKLVLLPCPFCGNKKIEGPLTHPRTGSVTLKCCECGGGLMRWDPDLTRDQRETRLVNYWNTRTPLPYGPAPTVVRKWTRRDPQT